MFGGMSAHLLRTSAIGNDGGAAAAGGLFAGGVVCVLLMALVGLVLLALQIWMVIDAATNAALDSTMKLVWILVIIFVPLGFVIYFAVARKAKTDEGRGFEVTR